jgi:hypothetical protein
MIRIMVALVFSVVSGVLAHFMFYPVVRSWENERFQLLARPAIGVFTALPAFLLWHDGLGRKGHGNNELTATVAYLTAFLLHGTGVAMGYLLDDLMDN